MNLIIILLLQLPLIASCQSQVVQKNPLPEGFDNYVKSILEDSTNRWKEYPKPPALTNAILEELSQELMDDSSKYYFEQLSLDKMKLNRDYRKALSYFERHQQTYAILAATAHWNPDMRVSALRSLNNVIKMSPASNLTKEKKEQLKMDNLNTIKFLIYLLKNNSLFIPGSENSTIHSFYISNITKTLNLLTNENITAGRPVQASVLYYTDTLKVAD